MRRVALVVLSGWLAFSATADFALAETATPATADSASSLQKARVTYVTQSIVYIDAGTRSGLAIGDVVEVVRGDNVAIRLEVFEVSSHKAACRRPEGQAQTTIEAGDTVRFHAKLPGKAAETPVAGKSKSKPQEHRDIARRLRDLGFSGRIGARYQMIYQDDTDSGYNRPGLDFRLRGHEIAGSNFDTDVDVRAYRSYRDDGGDDSSDSTTRVYRANVAWTPDLAPVRMVIGRQYTPSLANLSLFDGGLLEYNAPRFTVGAIAGTQPSPDDYGYSTDIQEYGVWGELHSLVGSERRWGTTLGLIGSYDGSKVNREYIYLQGRYDQRQLSLYLAQEVDINRSWKDDTESTISATSTNAQGRWRITDALSLSVGVDNRRNVQLYRDYVSPETDFDDDYRSGYWVRTDWRHGWLRTGFDVRFSRGGDNGDVNAYSAHVGAVNVTRLDLSLRSRTTLYDGDGAEGWLQSFTARAPIGQRVGLSLQGGLRDEDSNIENGPDTQLGWYGVDLDVTLGRHWLYLVSVERNEGDDEGSWQLYTALSYRF